jgi:hypothetical protein
MWPTRAFGSCRGFNAYRQSETSECFKRGPSINHTHCASFRADFDVTLIATRIIIGYVRSC